MRIIFFGTPSFSAHLLQFLIEEEGADVVAVVSRPDKPKGRSRQLAPTPVKEFIQKHHPHIPVYQPTRASADAFVQTLAGYKPDLFVVAAYGEIMRQNLLDLPKLMPINVHTSLLPKYRGAAPIQRALMNGESEGGVSIMEMVLEMDAGDILHVERMPIPLNMNCDEYEEALLALSKKALRHVLDNFKSGRVQRMGQNPLEVTFAPKITQEDCLIEWNREAIALHNQIRGLSTRPGAYALTYANGESKRLKILKTAPIDDLSGTPGKVLAFDKRFIVACGKGALEILLLQPEGKRPMAGAEYARGFSIPTLSA